MSRAFCRLLSSLVVVLILPSFLVWPVPQNSIFNALAPHSTQQPGAPFTREFAGQLLDEYQKETNPARKQALGERIRAFKRRLDKIKAVVFDANGVLYPKGGTTEVIEALKKEISEVYGLNFDDETIFKRFFTGTVVDPLRKGEQTLMKFTDEINATLLPLSASTSKTVQKGTLTLRFFKETLYLARPGAKEAVRALKERGIRTMVWSNGNADRLEKLIKVDFNGAFDPAKDLFLTERMGVVKPSAESFSKLEEGAGEKLRPDQIAFIDDETKNTEPAAARGWLTSLFDLEKEGSVDRDFLLHELATGEWRKKAEAALLQEESERPAIPKLFIEDVAAGLSGRRVLVRVDFNVPLEGSTVVDDTRIRGALPTVRFLLKNGFKPVLMSHLGRPKKGPEAEFSLRPAAKRLQELLQDEMPDVKVTMLNDCIGPDVVAATKNAEAGKEVVLLENLRFHAAEQKNSVEFARELAKNCDRLYVNDSFGTAHNEKDSSTVAIAQAIPVRAAGFLMGKEIKYLGDAVNNPQHPFVAILGGAKVSDKIEVINNLLEKVDTLIIGGAMAYTFLKAQGVEVGKSRVEEDKVELARTLLAKAKEKRVEILLPVDHVVVDNFESHTQIKVSEGVIEPDFLGLDIGPKSIKIFSEKIRQAKLVVWNGPMGVFERKDFSGGTFEIARAMAESEAITIVGGGDSVSAVNQSGYANKMTHISTGGGASLKYLEGKGLPAIAALTDFETEPEVEIRRPTEIEPESPCDAAI